MRFGFLRRLSRLSDAKEHRCPAHYSQRRVALPIDARCNAPFRSFRSLRFSSTQLFSFTSNRSYRRGIQGGTLHQIHVARSLQGSRSEDRQTGDRVQSQF